MTPTVPLPPAPEPWTSCAEAFEAWGEGRVLWDSLIDGAIVLADGTRCPVAESPHQVPVVVSIPPGQPGYVRPELAETGVSSLTVVLAIGLVLIVAGLLFLALTKPRKETAVGGKHWVGDADLEPNGPGDEALLAEVTGLGEEREPTRDAVERASELPTDWPDHRGDRDRNPEAPHPWRAS